MADALLRVSGLAAGYGDVRVLWGVDLEVPRGEIVGLIGSNGAGKTTLMRAVSGLIAATEGTVVFDGRNMANESPDRVLAAGIAHVPEGRRLFSAMSVRDNLLMGGYLRDDKAAIAADLERMYAMFPILRQRSMGRPRLLLIDELSLGLAPAIVDQLCDALRALNREGLSMLVVEQDVATALELSHRAFVMDTGRVTRSGTSDALRDDPAIREAYLGTL